jgi:phytanoyl-CoA hydroxylase
MLSREQIKFYDEQGYLRIPEVFTPDEISAMERDLDFIMDHWATTEIGWVGPWRKVLMDADTEQKSRLTSIHDLHFYSEAWMRGVTNPRLCDAMSNLLGPNVELHHTTLHAKPPETGHPFPMHQDNAFYEFSNGNYCDVLVHLDDTCHENGEIRFLAGSHKNGYLPHITQTPEGPCTPHLPTDIYKLEDTVPVPAKRGDVVCFNVFTVHGSYVNRTTKVRRLVRVGYRDPANVQVRGQSCGRPGIMVRGTRPRLEGATPFPTEWVLQNV